MQKALKILRQSISSNRFDQHLSQMLCYAGSLLVLVLGILKLCWLGLDEAHLFFGLLLVLNLAALGVIGGTLAAPRERPE